MFGVPSVIGLTCHHHEENVLLLSLSSPFPPPFLVLIYILCVYWGTEYLVLGTLQRRKGSFGP